MCFSNIVDSKESNEIGLYPAGLNVSVDFVTGTTLAAVHILGKNPLYD